MTILQFPQPWNDTIRSLPYAHILQTEEWGEFKRRSTGWIPEKIILRDQRNSVVGGALILTRRIGPLAVMYVPKGPMLDYNDPLLLDQMLEKLEKLAQRNRAIWIKIDPDVVAATGVPGEPDASERPGGQNVIAILKRRGWRCSDSQVQFRNTITVDLTRSEDEMLAAMGQGKRRKVRYGPNHGVTVRSGTLDDLPLLYKLYVETGQRDGFITRPYEYYADEWGNMMKAGLAHPLIAEVNGVAVAHVILFHFGRKCWYFYGASTSDNELRKLMPTDLLQWEAMRWAKAQGYAVYDMWGAPNEFREDDPMWGVFQFKRDFGGTVTRYIGAWDYAPIGPLYMLYTRLMPRMLDIMKRRKHSTNRVSKRDQHTSTETTLPSEVAKLSRVRQTILRCTSFGRKPDHPDVKAAALDLQAHLNRLLSALPSDSEPDKLTRAILEAGLLSYGRLDLVESILENMPEHDPKRPGAMTGICVALPAMVLRNVLPLPPDIGGGWRRLMNKHQVREWFYQHRDRLQWVAADERFVLK